MTTEKLENKIGWQIGFLLHSGKTVVDTISNLKRIAIDYHNENSELSNLQAIQEYLISRGTNDEEINTKIRELMNAKSDSYDKV